MNQPLCPHCSTLAQELEELRKRITKLEYKHNTHIEALFHEAN